MINSKEKCVFALLSGLPPGKFYHVSNINCGLLIRNTLIAKGDSMIMCFMNVFNDFIQK